MGARLRRPSHTASLGEIDLLDRGHQRGVRGWRRPSSPQSSVPPVRVGRQPTTAGGWGRIRRSVRPGYGARDPRLADRYRGGRVFLAVDAAHVRAVTQILVRPDGHIAYRTDQTDTDLLRSYLYRRAPRPRLTAGMARTDRGGTGQLVSPVSLKERSRSIASTVPPTANTARHHDRDRQRDAARAAPPTADVRRRWSPRTAGSTAPGCRLSRLPSRPSQIST